MKNILVISTSIRTGRRSHGVARYLTDLIQRDKLGQAKLLDLKELNLPMMEERLKFLQNPPASALAFSESVTAADAVILVCPEYNSSLPASAKNAIDLLNSEWQGKPVAAACVSAGGFGARMVWADLCKIMVTMGAHFSSNALAIANVQNHYSEAGLTDPDSKRHDERATAFVQSLLKLCQ